LSSVDLEWIVADDGIEPAALTMGQIHVRRQREKDCQPAQSFCRNLLAAIAVATGDVVVFWEHDDWYAPRHLETVCNQLNGAALLAGDDQQRYYNVAHRCWRIFRNRGASLCQTAMRSSELERFGQVVRECLAASRFYVDFKLWEGTPSSRRALARADTVLGIKGLPGRPGLGIGHRPDKQWTKDESFAQLWAWIGNDAELYEPFQREKP